MRNNLTFLFIAAFFIRLINLNQSLWLDEATTARVVQRFNLIEILQKFSVNDFHPPLYYWLMDLWTSLFGYSEIALRLPSVVFSLLTGWFVYLIGKKLKNETVGFWAAVLLLFNPLIIYYSQEARMYMIVTFLLTAGLYFYLQKRYTLFNLFSFLSFLTFYGSALFLIGLYAYLIWQRKYRELIKIIPGFVIGLIIVSPLLFQQWINSRIALSQVKNWSLVLGKANIKNLLLIPMKFSTGRISFEPKIFYWVVAGMWTLITSFFAFKGSFKNRQLPFILLAPLVLAFIISFNSPLLQYFRFLYLIPILSLLIALGVRTQFQRMLVTGGFLIFSLVYLLNPTFHREDWKSLVKELPNDKKILMISSSSDPVFYYNSKINITDLREVSSVRDKELVVIPYTADIHGVDYRTNLEKRGYKLEEVKSFRGLTFERWLIQGFYYSEQIPSPFD